MTDAHKPANHNEINLEEAASEKRVAIYARPMPNRAPLSAQTDRCREWAERSGYAIDEQCIYQEEGSTSVHLRE